MQSAVRPPTLDVVRRLRSAYSCHAMPLTSLRTQVVRLTSLGCTAKETAKILSLTPGEVINRKAQAMQKLGVNNVALLTRAAIRHGITSLDDKLTRAEKSCCEHRPPTASRLRHMVISELTERESQVVRLFSLGCTQDETAAILKVAPSTVGTRKARGMAKLDVNKTAMLVRVAIEHGITSKGDKLTAVEKRRSGRN